MLPCEFEVYSSGDVSTQDFRLGSSPVLPCEPEGIRKSEFANISTPVNEVILPVPETPPGSKCKDGLRKPACKPQFSFQASRAFAKCARAQAFAPCPDVVPAPVVDHGRLRSSHAQGSESATHGQSRNLEPHPVSTFRQSQRTQRRVSGRA